MTLFLLLAAAHFIGDFYLQPDGWIRSRNEKGVRSPALYLHAGVHALLALLALWLADASLDQAMGAVGLITATHFVIDWAKAGRTSVLAFAVDQLAHIAVIAAAVLMLQDKPVWELITNTGAYLTKNNLLYLLGYIIIFKPASILIGQLLSAHTEKLKQQNEESQEQKSLSNAGRWIGYVERLLALSFILVDEFTGLGFLVATKTVFRVGDLSRERDMRLTEYMMLGTLMSFAVALIVGWLILALKAA